MSKRTTGRGKTRARPRGRRAVKKMRISIEHVRGAFRVGYLQIFRDDGTFFISKGVACCPAGLKLLVEELVEEAFGKRDCGKKKQ